mmetsp:Transcript_20087/g.33331  ORF Transcript_20087/g.33331 Transcript_20087/m.33331 type:complete len:258 (-) Transcript_20087:180-953(-)|eukprot:CAMPEP_0119015848 /NCGR_PEP_ID=MMETSP1176-20130426/11684_1 /TAXON_ID=265551 /ORGANISM="Synedropsis recta cf, Strain CCMP1620" /LENGTH=257 /DNA_ID=CAMNT_0006969171 /DNA_START=313 /DNA_END=1086 /DNA_ORIENTATION=+
MTEETDNNSATPTQEPQLESQSEPAPAPAAVPEVTPAPTTPAPTTPVPAENTEPVKVAFAEPEPTKVDVEPEPPKEEEKTEDKTEKQEAPAPVTPEKQEKLVEEEKSGTPPPILTTSGRKRPPYKYDPNKVTLRFIFANRDGLAVTIECKPADTIGEIKGALLSVWPDELPNCSGGDRLRLVCMGKGILMPDTRSLEDCQVPVFKTHPTPVNVSMKPDYIPSSTEKTGSRSANHSSNNASNPPGGNTTSQGCACTIL